MTGMLGGKIVLVTGSGRGIGRGAALLFAREGARLVVADVLAEGAQETAELSDTATPVESALRYSAS